MTGLFHITAHACLISKHYWYNANREKFNVSSSLLSFNLSETVQIAEIQYARLYILLGSRLFKVFQINYIKCLYYRCFWYVTFKLPFARHIFIKSPEGMPIKILICSEGKKNDILKRTAKHLYFLKYTYQSLHSKVIFCIKCIQKIRNIFFALS